MQVIAGYYQIFLFKRCRKEPQRARNMLPQKQTNSLNKMKNTISWCIDGGDTAEHPHRTEYAKAYDAGCFGHKMYKTSFIRY